MKGNSAKNKQRTVFGLSLSDTLNPSHPLYKLTYKVPWDYFENEFSELYINFGRPGIPIRVMVSVLLLKHMYNLSDENVVERWSENPYWQYFSGYEDFQWDLPCDPTELIKFRKRIGSEGVEKILKVSALMHGKDALEQELIADTTCQEKNITYPTDTKLHIAIIRFCRRVASNESLKVRQSYRDTLPKLLWNTRYRNHKTKAKEARKATRKIKTIAGRLLRELLRLLSEDHQKKYNATLQNAEKILEQTPNDKNKIYSLHEPAVSCIAKGKSHKKYEFGSKASILITKNSCIIVGAKNFQGNPYDGNTLESALSQYEKIFGKAAKKVLVDEGYRGRSHIGETEVLRVHSKSKSNYSKWQLKQRFRRRAAVEPVIGHLKQDYRLGRNYLKGTVGDEINLMLASAAFNLKKLMRKLLFWLKFILSHFRLEFNNYSTYALFQA